jgi:mono/diheme cytochrome c family protein
MMGRQESAILREGIGMKMKAVFVALTAGASCALPAAAQDSVRGRLLYEAHCLSCHYERIHKREPAKSLVRSHAQLRLEVAQRAALVKARLTIEDLDDIAEYLNRSHYKLAK